MVSKADTQLIIIIVITPTLTSATASERVVSSVTRHTREYRSIDDDNDTALRNITTRQGRAVPNKHAARARTLTSHLITHSADVTRIIANAKITNVHTNKPKLIDVGLEFYACC